MAQLVGGVRPCSRNTRTDRTDKWVVDDASVSFVSGVRKLSTPTGGPLTLENALVGQRELSKETPAGNGGGVGQASLPLACEGEHSRDVHDRGRLN